MPKSPDLDSTQATGKSDEKKEFFALNYYIESHLAEIKLVAAKRKLALAESRLAQTPEEFCEEGVEYTINLPDGWIEYTSDGEGLSDDIIQIVPKAMIDNNTDGTLNNNPFIKMKRPTRPIQALAEDGTIIATYCFDCDGWVKGEVYSQNYDDRAELSGSKGIIYTCPVCDGELANQITGQS